MAKVLLPKRFEKEDIERWKREADKQNRNLTNWMETVLNKAVNKKVKNK